MNGASLTLLLLTLASAEARIEVDPYAAATEVIRFSFEESDDVIADFLPDDWVRRRGAGFPSYVNCRIDQEEGLAGTQSLRVDVNGGRLTYYSPFNTQRGHIDPAFNYVFRGFVRTQGLQHDAALFSISFLNSRRQRLQRFTTRPVSGTHKDWVKLEFGPMTPHPDARFVVLGCHVVHGADQDISGHVWFDDLWLGRLPRLTLISEVRRHYLEPRAPIEVDAVVSGLEPGIDFRLVMSLTDVDGTVQEENVWPLKVPSGGQSGKLEQTRSIIWSLAPRENGCYQVQAHLERDQSLMLLSQTTLVVMDSSRARPRGEFGWSLPHGSGHFDTQDLAWIAGQAGVNWVKIPLWKSVHGEGEMSPTMATELIERLSDRSISIVGLLSDPPSSVRNQFVQDWAGISEVFVLNPDFWRPSIEPVLARYGSIVEYWQLGDDRDFSFAGLDGLDTTIGRVKREFDRIGRNSRIGVQWPAGADHPVPIRIRDLFVTVGGTPLSDGDHSRAEGHHQQVAGASEQWTLLTPQPADVPLNDRANTLVREMIATRLRGVSGIFLADAFNSATGILNTDGSPTPLFLPWRTAALELRGAKHLGSFQLPNQPENLVFERDGKVTMVLPAATTEPISINLGDTIEEVDVWGHRTVVPRQSGRHVIAPGDSPRFLTGCSEAMARWRLETGFEKGRIPSEYGGHRDAIIGRNTFGQGIRGTVSLKLPRDWEADPAQWPLELAAGESFRLPTTIHLPQTASLGNSEVVITFDISTDRQRVFDIYRTFEVGLGDVVVDVTDKILPDGRLEIEQIVTNNTQPSEQLSFKCTLSVSGHKSQTQFVTRLGADRDRKIYYLPHADSLQGQELWLNLEQIGGRRNLNKRLIIGERDDSITDPMATLSSPDAVSR